ncbi:MAG: hypothetical protein ABIW30_02135 [Arenimonas sp.]
MLAALLFTCSWWIGLWDLHVVKHWDVASVAFYFLVAAGIYLQARLVSPRIPEDSDLDLQRFHTEEGRKYLLAYAILSWVTVGVNAVLGQVNGIAQWSAQNSVIVPMAVATSLAAFFIRLAWVQYFALAMQIGGWIVYFAFLQSALTGWLPGSASDLFC